MFAWVPLLVVWLFYWRLLIQYKKTLLFCAIGAIIFGLPWDYWATHHWLWHFSPDRTLGVEMLGIPAEEYVFFVSYALLYASLALVLRKKLKAEVRTK